MTSEHDETHYQELKAQALEAARAGDVEALRLLLDGGVSVNIRDENGDSLVMLAADHGHIEATRVLLCRGADPDLRNDRGQTPLGRVASKGGRELAELLLKHGADPEGDQGGGLLPFHIASGSGNMEIARLLDNRVRAFRRGRLKILSWFSSLVRSIVPGSFDFRRPGPTAP